MKKLILLTIIFSALAIGILIGLTYNPEGNDNSTTYSKDNENSTQDNILNLSNQNLNEVPGYMYLETDLEEINISHNKLKDSLKAEIKNLKKLKVLDISNNQFTGLPAEIGQLQELEILNISNNQLTGLPHELGNLQNLKELDLSGNDYSEFDLEIIRKQLPSGVIIRV